jgi:hypothetical protein
VQVIDEHPLVGYRVRAGFDQIELGKGSRLARSGAGDHDGALGTQMKFGGERRIDHCDLGTAIQLKVVGAGVVDGNRQDDLVAVDEAEGYTGGISRAMRFCFKRGNDDRDERQRSEPLEGCHCESSSAGWAEGTLGAWLYVVLMG